jgi:hypothetical protein
MASRLEVSLQFLEYRSEKLESVSRTSGLRELARLQQEHGLQVMTLPTEMPQESDGGRNGGSRKP